MRILHVLPSINPVTGGPAKSIPLQLKLLVKSGYHVELFTTLWPDFDTTPEYALEQDGIVVRVFPATPIWPLNHVPYSRDLIAAIHKNKANFDLFQSSSLWNPLISHATALFRHYRLPYVITCHGTLDPVVINRHRFGKWCWSHLCERRNVEEAECIQFMSEQEMLKAQALGWSLRRTIVFPINVDTAAGLKLPPREWIERDYPQLVGKEVIGFVGRINWVKNLDLLVAALAQVRQQSHDAVLLCVGPDSDNHRKQLELQATKLGVLTNVVFTGLLEGDALKAAYARADVVALVSRKENFGLAAAEALSAGVPVVLSDGVDMGKHWGAVPPVWRVDQSVESIARGLIAALVYSRETGVPCQAARQLADQEWGKSSIQNLLDLYDSILTDYHE